MKSLSEHINESFVAVTESAKIMSAVEHAKTSNALYEIQKALGGRLDKLEGNYPTVKLDVMAIAAAEDAMKKAFGHIGLRLTNQAVPAVTGINYGGSAKLEEVVKLLPTIDKILSYCNKEKLTSLTRFNNLGLHIGGGFALEEVDKNELEKIISTAPKTSNIFLELADMSDAKRPNWFIHLAGY